MAMRRVTFEVDTSELFDRLRDMKGDLGPLGSRLVEVLMAEPSTRDLLGLAVYGVAVIAEPK